MTLQSLIRSLTCIIYKYVIVFEIFRWESYCLDSSFNYDKILLPCGMAIGLIAKKVYYDGYQQMYHVGYTSSHLNIEVKQHWAWIILEWETLQGIYKFSCPPPRPPPLWTEHSLTGLSLSQSSDWGLP